MRDIDIMIAMLKEASEQPNGLIHAPAFMGGEGAHERHQAQLLADCGLIEWVNDSAARITNTGYDFLEGLNRREGFREKLDSYLREGIPILVAIAKAMQWLAQD